MKDLRIAFFISLFPLLFSCKPPNTNQNTVPASQDTLPFQTADFAEQARQDSIHFVQVLTDALKMAAEKAGEEPFQTSYAQAPYEVKIKSGYLFSKSRQHLVIHRVGQGAVYIDVFVMKGTGFENVLSHEQSFMTYTSDTIRDINGDGANDFVVNWYGATGCCLKAFSDVYLLKPNGTFFSDVYNFVNPTFSPNEKLIRGVCYGYAGETPMYKFGWRGEHVDTLEYVYFEKNSNGENTGKILVSKYPPDDDVHQKVKRLNAVPKEYLMIEGYDWFTGAMEE